MQAGSWVAGRLWQEVRMEWHQCGEEGDDDLVGECVREDLRQGRGERQATQAHWAMSCSHFSAGTVHSLNLTWSQTEAAPLWLWGLCQSPRNTYCKYKLLLVIKT